MLLTNFLEFWLIGLPFGATLAFPADMGVYCLVGTRGWTVNCSELADDTGSDRLGRRVSFEKKDF